MSATPQGYPFSGEVLGQVPLEPCTNYTEMFQNFNYTNPDNPSTGGGVVELTNAFNTSQIGSFPTPGYLYDDLPPAQEIFPWTAQDGNVYEAEAYETKCWNRSLSSPKTCTENCLEYFDLYGATWFYLGDLYCSQSYPVASAEGEVPLVPPPGNVTLILTNQCSQYTYGPSPGQDNVTMYTLTDTYNNVYALQTATTNVTTEEEWQELVDTAGYPEGWVVGTETLTESQMHYSYVIGNDCWLLIVKDSNGNAWQQYKYGQPLESSELLASITCYPLAKNVTSEDTMPSVSAAMVRAGSSSTLLHLITLLVVLFAAFRL